MCMLAGCSRKGRVSCREQFGHRVPRTARGSARSSSAGQARVNTPFSQNLLGQETVLSETRPSLEYDWGLPKLRGNGQRTRKRQPTNRSAERRQRPKGKKQNLLWLEGTSRTEGQICEMNTWTHQKIIANKGDTLLTTKAHSALNPEMMFRLNPVTRIFVPNHGSFASLTPKR